MASNQQNKPQATTPAPGAAGAADVNADKVDQPAERKEQSAEAPEWVEQLLASNAEVFKLHNALIASNEAVVAAVEQFKEKATEVIGEAISESKSTLDEAIESLISQTKEQLANVQKVEDSSTETIARKALPEVDTDATYVVKAGRKFQDKDSYMMYHEGDDVSHFDIPRLQSLLDQGIIEEK